MKFELIIPVIVFVVWVLNQLLRNREIDEPVRPRPGAQGPARGSTNDIDKFLQEIDRLRRKGNEDRAEPERPVVKPVPRARPVAAQPAPRVRPSPRVREQRPIEPVPEVTVVEMVPARPAAPPLPAVQRASQVDRRADGRISPAVATAMSLVRSPQSLAAAVILQEVLSPPKCRRR